MDRRIADSPFAFCPVLDDLVTRRTAVGKTGRRFDELGALSTNNNLLTLRSVALARRPPRTLEIGLAFGGSCLALAATHRDSGAPPSRQHTALDPFQHEIWDEVGLALVEQAGLSGYLDFREERSAVVLPKLAEAGETYDLVYIDGSHLFENAFVDYYFVNTILSADGIILFDDSSDPHVAKVLRFVETNMRGTYEPFDLTPYRPAGQNGLAYRLKKAVGRTQLTAYRKIGPTERAWNSRFHRF